MTVPVPPITHGLSGVREWWRLQGARNAIESNGEDTGMSTKATKTYAGPASYRGPGERPFDCECGDAVHASNTERPGGVTLPDGRRVCVPVAATWEREAGKVAEYLATGAVIGYRSGDPTRTDEYKRTDVTTHLGNPMFTITRATWGERKVTGTVDASWYTGKSYSQLYVSAVDADGNEWRGWGVTDSWAITMRRVKRAVVAA